MREHIGRFLDVFIITNFQHADTVFSAIHGGLVEGIALTLDEVLFQPTDGIKKLRSGGEFNTTERVHLLKKIPTGNGSKKLLVLD